MIFTKFKLLILLIPVILLAGAGCTQQEVKPTPTATPTAAVTHVATPSPTSTHTPTVTPTPARVPSQKNITIKDYAFFPKDATISAGDTVRWYNDQNLVTTLIAEDGSWNSTPMDRGQTYIKEFPFTGTFNYTIKGMSAVRGSITVLP